MPTQLSVNLNKVALVRNTRHLGIPSVTRAAQLCLQAGAHGITVHPRPDARHIRADDVHALAALMRGWPGREFNIEGNPTQNLMDFIRQTRPHQALLAVMKIDPAMLVNDIADPLEILFRQGQVVIERIQHIRQLPRPKKAVDWPGQSIRVHPKLNVHFRRP